MASRTDIVRDSSHPSPEIHPWLTFEIRRLDQLPAMFWEQLGEARSECLHLARTPLPPQISRELSSLYLAKGVRATAAIGGNSLSEAQALDAIRGRLEVPRSREYLKRELENVAGAYSGIEARIRGGDSSYEVTPELLRELNRQVLDGLEVEQHGVSGELRSEAVVASGEFLGAPAPDREHLLELLCAWLNGPDFEPGDNPSQNFLRGVVRAVLAHVYIEWIRPFGDGNGQTARLVEFGILASAGVPLAAAHLLADHYDQTRTAYRRQLAHATRSGGDVRVFLAYAIEGFVDGLQAQLRLVYEHVANVTWAAYVHEVFQGADTRARTRQREIVLALPTEAADPWMPRARIPAISSKVAELYSGRGPKAVSRDINALFDLGLIERRRDAIRPKVEIMLGFLPPVASTAVF